MHRHMHEKWLRQLLTSVHHVHRTVQFIVEMVELLCRPFVTPDGNDNS